MCCELEHAPLLSTEAGTTMRGAGTSNIRRSARPWATELACSGTARRNRLADFCGSMMTTPQELARSHSSGVKWTSKASRILNPNKFSAPSIEPLAVQSAGGRAGAHAARSIASLIGSLTTKIMAPVSGTPFRYRANSKPSRASKTTRSRRGTSNGRRCQRRIRAARSTPAVRDHVAHRRSVACPKRARQEHRRGSWQLLLDHADASRPARGNWETPQIPSRLLEAREPLT